MRKSTKVILGTLLGAVVFCCGDIYLSCNALSVSKYTYASPKMKSQVRLVLLSDLHGHSFGSRNRRLIKKVTELSPDVICMAGDFLNSDSKDSKDVVSLIKELDEAASVYYSIGNHEKAYMEKSGEDLLKKLEEAGACAVDEAYQDITVKGNAIRIGGMCDYAFQLETQTGEEYRDSHKYRFLEEFQDTDELKVMLAHLPDSFVLSEESKDWDIDMILSGHLHGGQVRIPGFGGLYGGDQGWFPKYASGEASWGNAELFITRGLGTHGQLLPRFHNIPEIMVIDIQPGQALRSNGSGQSELLGYGRPV